MNRVYRIYWIICLIIFLFSNSAAAQSSQNNSNKVIIAAGSGSLAGEGDNVWAWGDNSNGQLGDGKKTIGTTPGQVINLNAIITVSSSNDHSLALNKDGTVWAWGENYYGELGIASTVRYRAEPVQVPGLDSVVAVTAGTTHSLALKNDGTVWTWGRDNYGQLGDGSDWSPEPNYNGTYSDQTYLDKIRSIPDRVQNLDSVIALATGDSLCVALKSDGTVWAWGNGQSLGIGITATPVQLPNLESVVKIAAGNGHILALKSDGTVWAAGYNAVGQLGDGTTEARSVPVRVSNLDSVVAIAGGWGHSLALKSDGTVWAWGANSSGELGDGSTVSRTAPVKVSDLGSVVAIAGGRAHSLAVKSDGTVWAWGRNDFGQLGEGSTIAHFTPVQVQGLGPSIAAAGGNDHSLAVSKDGQVWAWGTNGLGQLGDGSRFYRSAPVMSSSLKPIALASAKNGAHSMAVDQDGNVWAWGRNGSGQLGDGTTTDHSTAIEVPNLNSITGIAAGVSYSLALKSDGTVWAWGSNSDSQLGDGKTWFEQRSSAVPVQVYNLDSVSALAAGTSHNLALKNDGTVWTWGNGIYGQLGDGSAVDRSVPVRVSDLNSVIAVAAGQSHSLALKSDGTVWAWGGNYYGQIGDGTYLQRSVPVRVPDLDSVVAISAGNKHSLALKSDGSVWAWGNNDSCQLGNGSTNSTIPVKVSFLYSIVAIAAGDLHNLAVKKDGTVWSWGYNDKGQLGDGTASKRLTPVKVAGLPLPGDHTSPVTTAALNPAAPNGKNGWYTQDVSVTLSASDDSSGVSETVYRINGGEWAAYAGPITEDHDGTYIVDYQSMDRAGNAENPKSVSFEIDKTAPSLTIRPDEAVLWPPNHKLVTVTMATYADDAGSGIASIVLAAITSNEPDDGQGDGDTANDIQNAAFGSADMGFSLRAERSGSGSGRVYTITYIATDNAGNRSSASTTVSIPFTLKG